MAELNPKLLATIIAVAKKEAGKQARDISKLESSVKAALLEFNEKSPILEAPEFYIKDGCLCCKMADGTVLELGNIVGPKGDRGPRGPTGASGKKGKDGKDGKRGPTGRSGKDGKRGPTGASGKDGKDGKHGAQGPRGPKGPVGLRGEPGPPGKDGKDGKDGKAGVEGPAGTGIEKIWVDDNYHLTFRLTSGKTVDAGYVRGPRGNSGGKGGRVTGGTYAGSGGYSPYVTGVTINQDGNIEITLSNGNIVTSPVPVSSGTLKWIDWVSNWSSVPVLQASIAEGDVYLYTYEDGTAYRLVPTDGVSVDSFYSSFTGNVLSDLIIARGMAIT